MLTAPPGLARERRIVWVRDIENLDYVRVHQIWLPHRVGGRLTHLWVPADQVVGYTELHPHVRPNGDRFERRIFTHREYDRGGPADEGVYAYGTPSEAVDPRTLAPGEPGQMTERAWGGPLWHRRIKLATTVDELHALYDQAEAAGQWNRWLTDAATQRETELMEARA